jgi:hypothetical protein
MGMLDTKELAQGMIVGEDVTTPGGRLILSSGTKLEDRHIRFLQRWGISRVNIQGEIDPGALSYDQISAQTLSELEGYLNPCFACNDINDPLIRKVYDIGLAHLAHKAASGWKIQKKDPFVPVNEGNLSDIFIKGEGTPTDLVRHEVELVSFPDIYFRIREAIDQKNASADKIAEVVSKDTSLSAKLLRLVNSPFYGLRERIGSISRAVTLIGAQELSSLALGISAINGGHAFLLDAFPGRWHFGQEDCQAARIPGAGKIFCRRHASRHGPADYVQETPGGFHGSHPLFLL